MPFLGEPASPHATDRVLKSVVFTDIVDSTPKATAMGDSRWHKLLDHHDELVSEITPRWGGSVIKHTGDGVLLAFDGPARALHCAQQIRQALKALDIEIRCGVHTGEVERRDALITVAYPFASARNPTYLEAWVGPAESTIEPVPVTEFESVTPP